MENGNITLLMAEKYHTNIYKNINKIENLGWRENSIRKYLLCKRRELQNSVFRKYPKRQARSLIPVMPDLRKWRQKDS